MKTIKGQLIKISNTSTWTGKVSTGSIDSEVSANLKISQDFIDGAGTSARSTKSTKGKKSWEVSGSAFITPREFYNLYYSIRWISPQQSILFSGTYADESGTSHGISLSGNCIYTELSFSASVHGLVKMSFQAVGNGMPTITIA